MQIQLQKECTRRKDDKLENSSRMKEKKTCIHIFACVTYYMYECMHFFCLKLNLWIFYSQLNKYNGVLFDEAGEMKEKISEWKESDKKKRMKSVWLHFPFHFEFSSVFIWNTGSSGSLILYFLEKKINTIWKERVTNGPMCALCIALFYAFFRCTTFHLYLFLSCILIPLVHFYKAHKLW